MSTTPPTPAARGPLGRWLNFWFAPSDPTTLGFMRVVTGLLVLYCHLAYCFDLQAFFGKDGWYGLDYINRERREAPGQVPPFWGPGAWTEAMPGAHVPEYPHRREAVLKYLRALPDTPAGLAPGVRYLETVQGLRDEGLAKDALLFVQLLSADDVVRKAWLDALVKKELRQSQPVPVFVARLPEDGPDGRAAVARDIEAFYKSLPADLNDRTFVLNHLIEVDWYQRNEFLAFMREVAAAGPDDRKALIDYMDYWNNERRYAFRIGAPIFSLWFHITDPAGMAAAHGVILVVMVLFTLGVWTRVTSILTWLAAASYIHRNQQVLFGMDTMMNILLIYLMVGNCGAALSVDRLIARYRAARASLGRTGGIDAPTRAFLDRSPPSVSAGFAARLLQVHFCFIYLASGLAKLKGGAWWNTMAYWDTLVNPEFTPIHYRWYEFLVRQLTAERPVFALAAAGGVMFTFACEIGLPFLVWTRLRPYWVMMGLTLHAGIAVFMGLWVFSLLMMVMLLGYLPGAAVRDRLFGAGGGDRVVVRFDRRSARRQRAAAAVAAADFDGQVAFADGPGFAVEVGGKTVEGPAAAAELVGRLGWLRPVGWVRRVPVIGGAVTRLLTGAEPAGVVAGGRPKAPAGS